MFVFTEEETPVVVLLYLRYVNLTLEDTVPEVTPAIPTTGYESVTGTISPVVETFSLRPAKYAVLFEVNGTVIEPILQK